MGGWRAQWRGGTCLGMNRSTVLFRMKKLGIVKPWKIEN
jgi:hypothetical protein